MTLEIQAISIVIQHWIKPSNKANRLKILTQFFKYRKMIFDFLNSDYFVNQNALRELSEKLNKKPIGLCYDCQNSVIQLLSAGGFIHFYCNYCEKN